MFQNVAKYVVNYTPSFDVIIPFMTCAIKTNVVFLHLQESLQLVV